MKNKLFNRLVLSFVLIFFFIENINYPVLATANTKIVNILILNSYHKEFAWSDDETSGITETLKNSGINFNISVEYLDWKRYPTVQNETVMYDTLNYKYSKQNIDLIISTDER